MSTAPPADPATRPANTVHRRDLLAAGYALILVCIGSIGIGMPRPAPRPKPDFSLNGWQQGQTELDALFTADTERLKAHPPGDAAKDVIIAYERLGRIESEKSSPSQKKRLEKATIAAANAAIDYWFTAGEDAWRGLGVFLVLRFEKALDLVLAARDVDGATLSRWLVNHRDHPLTRRLRETSGTFVEFALGSGLLDEKGYMAGSSPALLRLHFQGRWYLLIQSLRDYMQLYRRDELLAKWRWSLEGDRNVSMSKRLEKARQIREHDSQYPVYASLGALYAKRGQTLLAIDAYRNALLEDPFNRTLAKNLNFLVLSQQH